MDSFIGGNSGDKMHILKKLAIAIFIFTVIFITIWGAGFNFSTTDKSIFFTNVGFIILYIFSFVMLLFTILIHYNLA